MRYAQEEPTHAFVEEYAREHAHDAIRDLLYVSEFCDKPIFKRDVLDALKRVDRHIDSLRNLCA